MIDHPNVLRYWFEIERATDIKEDSNIPKNIIVIETDANLDPYPDGIEGNLMEEMLDAIRGYTNKTPHMKYEVRFVPPKI